MASRVRGVNAGVVLLAAALAGCLGGPGGPPVKKAPLASAAAAAPVNPQPALTAPDASMTEPDGVPIAVIKTEKGVIKLVLLRKIAPNHVRNFVALANRGYFNNLLFHRVIPNVIIQTGDPKGDGTGGPGYSIKAEFSDHPYGAGTVGMARTSDPDSAGSQWFIAMREMPQWVHTYTVFGQVLEGMDVVRAIQRGDRMQEVRIDYVPDDKVPAELLK